MLTLRTPVESPAIPPAAALARARVLLSPPVRRGSSLGVLAAAAACAACAILLAGAVIFGAPLRTSVAPEIGANPLPQRGAQQPLLSH